MRDLAPSLTALTELAARAGSMTATAEALGVSQSSVSRRLHGLEEQLGISLLVRDGRKVQLTAEAVALIDEIRGPLAELERAVERSAGRGDADHGTVRFGFPLTMGTGLVPELLAAFHHHHPNVHLELKQAHGSELIDDLRAGDLDLAITIPPAAGLRHKVIGTQEILAVLPERHRYATADSVTLEQLADETFIANPASYNLRQLTQQWCLAAGFAANIAIEITEFGTIRELVERGLGVALLPESGQQIAGIVEVPVRPQPLQRSIALAWPSTISTPVVETLSAFLIDNLPRG